MMNEKIEELNMLSQTVQMCNAICSVWNKYGGDKKSILYLLQIRDDLALKRNELIKEYEEENKIEKHENL